MSAFYAKKSAENNRNLLVGDLASSCFQIHDLELALINFI
jgi:hypothetical protein